MGHLQGFDEYLARNAGRSIITEAVQAGQPWCLHLHGDRTIQARILEESPYQVRLQVEGGAEETLHKTSIKLLYPAERQGKVAKLLQRDPQVARLRLEPLVKRRGRHWVKNKTLYALMSDREVVFVTLLEGEVVRGLILGFTMFELTLGMKGGVEIHILRHALQDLRNKQKRPLLKAFQQRHKDWMKSSVYVDAPRPVPAAEPSAGVPAPGGAAEAAGGAGGGVTEAAGGASGGVAEVAGGAAAMAAGTSGTAGGAAGGQSPSPAAPPEGLLVAGPEAASGS